MKKTEALGLKKNLKITKLDKEKKHKMFPIDHKRLDKILKKIGRRKL